MRLFKSIPGLALIFLISLFSLLLFVFVYFNQYIETAQQDNLVLERELTKLEIDHHFHVIETAISDVSGYLSTHDDDDDLLAYLMTVDQESDMMASIYIGRPDKTMINSSGFVPGPDFDLTQRVWYQMAIASDDTIYTPAFINASNDKVIVVAAKAIYQDDALIGVIGVDIDVRTIAEAVAEKHVGETGYALLMDQNDVLIAYPGLDADTIRLDEASVLSLSLGDLQDSGFLSEFEMQGELGVITYTEIAKGNYQIALFMPIAEFTQNTRTFTWVALIVLISLVALTIILSIVYQVNIGKPLQTLIADISLIDLDNNPDYRLKEFKRSRYKDIRKALNNSLDTAAKYLNNNKEYQHKLLLENQKVTLLMESAADIIFEVDVNRRFRSIFGKGLTKLNMTAKDVVGKTVLEVFGQDGKDRDEIYVRALAGEHMIYDWQLTSGDSMKYFESSISPMYDENAKIIGAVGITRDITEPMQKQMEIEYISLHDFLTGLYNRRYFVEQFSSIDNEKFYPISLFMLDLNGLKIFNDAYGHDVGDEALKLVGRELKGIVTGSRNFVARIGGDEFAIVMINTDDEEANNRKRLIKDRLSELTVANIPVSVAVGYSVKSDQNIDLEEMIKIAENQMYRNKITESKSIRNNAIEAILKTLTDKYEEEKVHSKRVSEYCRRIGEALKIHSDDLKELEMAGLYHDIGKISVPDAILDKPAKLTDEEYEIIKTHTENGYNILRAADEYSNLAEFALSHHERWDGKGYPRGLKGVDIPYFARIIAVADAFEAMTSDRPYRKAMSMDVAVKELKSCAGTQFDPDIVQTFVTDVIKTKI
ncbi:MAG: diguanylate cyclase [Bacilli bacterium]|nr:diguanylate cyclase [Bacilli bacterium]MBN2695982.1 diguanylate cyclase [Bacilli bacterium]